MLADRFGLQLSTSSTAARDAYVDASERALTFYPGALAAYDSAIAADPRFSLAHAGKTQVLMREGNVAGARTALVAAVELTAGLTEREASHIAISDLGSTGQTEAAIAAVNKHLTSWPCDALVISIAANPNGLIGGSGRLGQKHQIAELMDSVAPHYGDDYWFLSYHAMALAEDGQLAEARPKIERSVALNPKNAHGAHGFAHVCYESGQPETARAFLLPWLAEYPRDGFFYGHLSWQICRWSKSHSAIWRRHNSFTATPSNSAAIAAGRSRRCRMGAHFCGGPNSPAIRATNPPGALCTIMRARRCRGRPVGSPTCTSSWRMP
jgi:tetratricopeptide (TPR) repeat protein